jgi:hypothetical protein
MRNHLDIARGLTVRIAAAVIVAVVAAACCEARPAALSPAETGFPSDLINRPVCANVDGFDDWLTCRTTGWPEGRSRSLYRPLR